MLSIDRVRTTTLNLLGFAAAGLRAAGMEASPSRNGLDSGDHDDEADPSPSRSDPFSPEDPAFAAVAAALKEAGYLDS